MVPVAWMIGVEWKDCRTVASLIGIKLFTSDILAFMDLGEITSAPILGPNTGMEISVSTTAARKYLANLIHINNIPPNNSVINSASPHSRRSAMSRKCCWNIGIFAAMYARIGVFQIGGNSIIIKLLRAKIQIFTSAFAPSSSGSRHQTTHTLLKT